MGGTCDSSTIIQRVQNTQIRYVIHDGLSAPLRGTTLCTEAHLDNGFAVTSVPRGKEWFNGKVKRPSA